MSFANYLRGVSASASNPNLDAMVERAVNSFVNELKQSAFLQAKLGKTSLHFNNHDEYEGWKVSPKFKFESKKDCNDALEIFTSRLTKELGNLGFHNISIDAHIFKCHLDNPKTWNVSVESIDFSW